MEEVSLPTISMSLTDPSTGPSNTSDEMELDDCLGTSRIPVTLQLIPNSKLDLDDWDLDMFSEDTHASIERRKVDLEQ